MRADGEREGIRFVSLVLSGERGNCPHAGTDGLGSGFVTSGHEALRRGAARFHL